MVGYLQVFADAVARIIILSSQLCGAPSPVEPDPHVRASDRQVAALIGDAARTSPTIRLLLLRLAESDTVVYVDRNPNLEGARSGELTFIASSGGRRYVRVELQTRLARRVQIAALGHELRHAVEVAEAPQVVDAASLADLYERIGYEVARRPRAFESRAAIVTSRQVERELSNRPPDQCARAGRTIIAKWGRSRQMDEHDDDLDSEVIEGEEIETDSFDPDDDKDVRSAEDSDEGEEEAPTEDDSEI